MYIDQSGKIGDGSCSTGLAFSDENNKDFTNAVHIKKEHKQRLSEIAIDDLGGKNRYLIKLFSLGVFMLVQSDIHRIREIRIDQEYEGKEEYIKNHLTNFLDQNTDYSPSQYPEITTTLIGKELDKPECHDISYRAREKDLDHYLESDLGFMKAMMLTSNR